MKRLITLLASLLVLCSGTAVAQEYVPTPVTVSKEKVKLNGKVYLSHVVLERQTLYGISKAYGVSEEELYEANPSLRETGLQKNAILLIPYRDNAAEAKESTPQNRQDGYTEHTVKWYEDIEDIARRYGVSVKDIMELNGLKSKKLSTRQVLKIPVKKNMSIKIYFFIRIRNYPLMYFIVLRTLINKSFLLSFLKFFFPVIVNMFRHIIVFLMSIFWRNELKIPIF